VSPFGSKSSPHRVQVLTLDYLVEGTADLSGQNLIRIFELTDATMRAASGSTEPAPRGSTWAIGEEYGGLIATLGTWRPPSALLFISQLQGIVVAAPEV
jgi:hypothetical protein